MIQPEGTIETIPTKVEWKNRKSTDVGCGILFFCFLLSWFAVGFAFLGSAKTIYVTNEEGFITGFTDAVKEEAKSCCEYVAAQTDTAEINYNEDSWLCWSTDRRNLHEVEGAHDFTGRRHLASSGNFPSDGGMLDVFTLHPEVAFTMIMAVICIAIGWIFFLRSFAKTVVWTCEFVKVGCLAYLGVKANMNPFFFAMALAYVLYLICFRKKLNFAATIIAHSAKGLKANPSMLPALVILKLCYIVQALLFIQFIAKSMEIKEVAPVQREALDYSSQFCDAGDSYYCDYDDYDYAYGATNPNWCDNNGGTCMYRSSGFTVECDLLDPSWVGSARWFIMFFWLWCIMWYSTARLTVVAQVIGSWHFHPEDKPGAMKALKNAITTSFGTVSFGSLICAIVEQFYKWARLRWYHFIPPLIFMIGPLKIALCILAFCFKTCIKMLTKFSIIIHAFTGLPFVGSAKKCFQIMKRHFVGGFIVESSSVAIMKIFSLVMSLAFSFSTWAWVDDLFGWTTLPGSSEDALWIFWTILAVFNIFYPLIGIFFLTLLDKILNDLTDDPTWWVSPLCAMFVGCIAKLFFDYMGGIILDTIDVMFMCFAIDKDNNVDMSKSEFSAIIIELPGLNKAPNPSGDANASLLVQAAAPVPVAAGQFVTTGMAQPQGMVQPFSVPGQAMQMQPMVGANGQPMQMMQQPMMQPMMQMQPMVDANGQPMQMMQQPMMQMQPMVDANGQPMQPMQQQMVFGQAPTPL